MAGGMNSGRMRDIGLQRLARAAEGAHQPDRPAAAAETDNHNPAGPWRPVLSLAKNDAQLWGEALAYALGATNVPVDQLHTITPEVMEHVAARAHAFLLDHRPKYAVDPRQAAPKPE
jgi:hypothetical protein